MLLPSDLVGCINGPLSEQAQDKLRGSERKLSTANAI